MARQIVLVNLDKPREKTLEKDVYWLCDSFGLSSGRDVDNMATRIVMSLLDNISEKERISSEMIADSLGVNPSRVNHHLRNLINSGLVYREKRKLYLRGGSLKAAVQEMRKDSQRMFDELEAIAAEIDQEMGIRNR
ncbi:putative transcriptional regulator [Methanohalophilus levihalophilus]|uniref:ArsR family transcriptional regulator n=1 Tax=Methanohalophilus levihalophilus TaxID=1431282 RepID=UPI001AE500D0|nr:ArsR family transcriptional regulator [Methanohalophilus levihalophilus]MBP2030275.1 putative transcriptional regulator [Methanohalophilus levihalophilus]